MLVCKNCGRQYATEKDFLTGTSRWVIDDQKVLWFRCSCNESLNIPEGKYDWYSPADQLSASGKSVFNQLSGKLELPHIPQFVLKLQELLMDPDSDTGEIANTAKKDPMFAVEILNQANNLKVASGQKIESIEHAITYIGRDALNEIVMLASLKTIEFKCMKFTADEFWQMAQISGIVCESLVREFCTGIQPEEGYLAGSLSNIGKVVAAICLPDEVDAMHDSIHSVKTLTSWKDAEDQFGCLDHTVLGEIACRMWGMPDYVLDAAISHHAEDLLNDGYPIDLKCAVALANQITHWIMLRPHLMDEAFTYKLANKFGLDEDGVGAFADKVKGMLGEDLVA